MRRTRNDGRVFIGKEILMRNHVDKVWSGTAMVAVLAVSLLVQLRP
jgi:hypothetical protein